MTELKVLIEGYAEETEAGEHASCSTTLLRENGVNVIVDPGMDRALLLESLKKEGLAPKDIQYVVLTHTHLDHCYLVGIFENAKVLDVDAIYSADGRIVPHEGRVPGTDIEIMKTPGHHGSHCSVLVRTEEYGKVIVAGDVFWWRTGEAQDDLLHHEDPYLENEAELLESRKKVLEMADWIVPGHGKMFQAKP